MTAAAGLLRRHPVSVALGVGLVIQCLPLLTTRVLPFHDAPGIVGLAGALNHLADPRARIADFYDVDIGAYPSALYFGWAFLLGKLAVPADVAFSVYTALFCLAGPPLALLLLLRAFGRPPALVLLALPVGYHHQIWYGFLGSASAITFLVLAIAFGKRAADGGRLRDHLGFAAALLATALAHPFSFALALAVVAPFVVWPGRRPSSFALRTGARLACFVPALAFLASWGMRFFAAPGGGGSAIARARHELRLNRPPLAEDAKVFLQWLGDGYASGADDLAPLVALATLAALLIVGARASVNGPAPSPTGTVWLGWAAAVLALGYLLLPNKIYWPTYWWALRVRCVVPLTLVLIALVRPRARGLPGWALAPAMAAAVALALGMAYDFRTHFARGVLAGFDEAIEKIPPGQSVLAMPAYPDRHYTRAHPYLVQHYVSRKGGRATPFLGGHPGSYWVTLKPPPESPPWGERERFDWAQHSLGWDYFLVEMPPGQPLVDPIAPIAGGPSGAARLLSDEGAWRLYERAR